MVQNNNYKTITICLLFCGSFIAFYMGMCVDYYNVHEFSKIKGDIVVTVFLTYRKGYSNFTASVLKHYQKSDRFHLQIVNNYPDKYNNRVIRDMYGEETSILNSRNSQPKFTKPFFGNTDIATKQIVKSFRRSNFKVMLLLDSEMVLLDKKWKAFVTKYMISDNIPFLSLYHSAEMHSPTEDCKIHTEALCDGQIHGGHGVAINKHFARAYLHLTEGVQNDSDWNEVLRKLNISGLYPRESLLMCIGQFNQNNNYCGENHVPYGFQMCDLPKWIRDGVEFYFDRCTNPEEIYNPITSKQQIDEEQRNWTRPVVAYSFYGNDSLYVNGALENTQRVFTIYPGWKVWIYVDDSLDPRVVRELCSRSTRFINMTESGIANKMSWRFLIAAEPVPMFTILDIDYRMLVRGKEAVDDWIKSGKKFHVMRDHPYHSKFAMSGGMWGGRGGAIPNIRQLIDKYHGNDHYLVDMEFLSLEIWPLVKKDVWVHDAYSTHQFGDDDHPFPTKRRGGEFIGSKDF